MAKTFKTAGAKPTTDNGNSVKRNGRSYTSAGVRFPSFLKPEDFDGQTEFQLINENYSSENLTDDNGNIKEFYELANLESGEMFIVEKFGHLKYSIEQIPQENRKMPLYLIIRYKGKQPLRSNPKLSSHLFQVDWAND